MSLMIDRVFLFLLWIQTDNLVVMPGEIRVMTWKLCVTIIIKVDLPAINWANRIIHARLNPDNAQCLDNISTLRIVCGFLMMVLNVMYWFCLYYNQVDFLFLNKKKSPPMITMLITRTAKLKGQREIQLKLRCGHLFTSLAQFDTFGILET